MSIEQLSPDDLSDLRYAKQLLENPGFAAQAANLVAIPIEKGFKLLPQFASNIIVGATNKSLEAALKIAVLSMADRQQPSANWRHKLAVTVSGAVGGAFGLLALAIELPISTAIMLRSIADIARSEGECITSVQTNLACLEVFALGGRSGSDDAAESGYFVVRMALAKAMTEAAEFIAERSMVQEAAPPLLRFIAQISTRFGVQVSEKSIAQMLPVIGAAGGALINLLFIDHFQNMARGHFIVRRLERKYDSELIRAAYVAIPAEQVGKH